MALKKKLFRIDATLAAAFEAWCQTRAMKQEQAAEAALFHLLGMTPQAREELFVELDRWLASQASEPASGRDVGAAVAAALQRRGKARARSKSRPGRRSA